VVGISSFANAVALPFSKRCDNLTSLADFVKTYSIQLIIEGAVVNAAKPQMGRRKKATFDSNNISVPSASKS